MTLSDDFKDGRAEGLALALLAILGEICSLDLSEYPKRTMDGIIGYVDVNARFGELRVLRGIVHGVGEPK